jgi:hypothetical protein
MSNEIQMSAADLDERTRQAVRELQGVIAARYPTATFALTRSPEDPASLHLLAIADVDDPDEVGDLVVERVVALQVEEGIPLHVIPLRSRNRVEATGAAAGSRAHQRLGRLARLWRDSAELAAPRVDHLSARATDDASQLI